MLGWYGLQDSGNSSTTMYDKESSPPSPNPAVDNTASTTYHTQAPTAFEDGDEQIHIRQQHDYKQHQQQCDVKNSTEAHLSSQKEYISKYPGLPTTVPQAEIKPVVMPQSDSEIDYKDKVNRWDGLALHEIPSTPMVFEVGLPNQIGSVHDRKMAGRKLIGMRYLFPAPNENLSLLEKAKIWVARHDYKYFVGWSQEQLQRVDDCLRPICHITPELYKMHMNRSEYCRNVKLKYCLESDTDWAQEFRERLAKPYNKGGFSGLCQAKIVAAELWRKHSENYKSHQARYPNPKSKYRSRKMSTGSVDMNTPLNYQHQLESFSQGTANDFYNCNPDNSMNLTKVNLSTDSYMGGYMREDSNSEQLQKVVSLHRAMNDPAREEGDIMGDDPVNPNKMTNNYTSLNKNDINRFHTMPPCTPTPEFQDNQYVNTIKENLGDTNRQRQQMQPTFSYPISQTHLLEAPISEHYGNIEDASLNSMTSAALSNVVTQIKKTMNNRNNDYRKSERGLSYLFPSLIDQQLSLVDKVRITVLRHKNNYFLGWNEEQLKRVDPLVRPKMPVTRELYKEYCHRNAMKYDSNLQFAMESQATWAREFRDRLVKPPNEGGFHSLCEVKQEAGRLWKEFSGRYKMHNVVKAQMDMNNEHARTPSVFSRKDENVDMSMHEDMCDLRSTTSSPGPRLDRITSPSNKYMSRSANSSPTPNFEVFRYPNVEHMSRKRKQSSDSGCSSLASPSNGGIDSEIRYQNFVDDNIHMSGKRMYGMNYNISQEECFTTDSYLKTKIARYYQAHVNAASEVTNNTLFAPLPPELSIADQLVIWLQRHQNNYFLGWSQIQIDKLNPFLRPLYVVNQDVLKIHVSPTMFAMFDKVDEIMRSLASFAKPYQSRINLPAFKGGFKSLEEALVAALEIWTTHCQPKISPPLETVKNLGLLKLKDMFRAKSSMMSIQDHHNNEPHNTLEGLLHCSKDTHNGSTVETKPILNDSRTMHSHQHKDQNIKNNVFISNEAVLDLSCNKSVNNRPSDNNNGEAAAGAEPNSISTLWSCRQQLQAVCKDSVASSWQDRLQPHLPLLYDKLGDSYTLPASVSDCMVDLMLVLLHRKLTQT